VMDMLNEGEECPEPAPRRCAANLSIWRVWSKLQTKLVQLDR
jgi:hypothetical protein